MRKYEKPMMQVEKYSAANAVATGCYEETTTVFPEQKVDCVINTSEYIFNKDQVGSECDNDVSEGHLGTYNSQYYFVWYTGASDSVKPDTTTLTAIEQAIWPAAVGVPGWHAGPVTSEQYKKMNQTS